MPKLSPEQEEEIIRAITDLEWTRDPDPDAEHAIKRILGCGEDDAKFVLEDLYLTQRRMECRNESGGVHRSGEDWNKSRWKYFRI
jgi:hypothetical protein